MTKKKTQKATSGRKPAWDLLDMDTKLPLIEYWSSQGYTEESMQQSIGISHTTWAEWKKQKPEFVEALKRGKEIVDALLVNKAIQKAIGYKIEEVEVIESEQGMTRKVKEKFITSDTMHIFLLKNRMPDKYQDKTVQDVNHSGEFTYSHLTDEDIEAELKKLGGNDE